MQAQRRGQRQQLYHTHTHTRTLSHRTIRFMTTVDRGGHDGVYGAAVAASPATLATLCLIFGIDFMGVAPFATPACLLPPSASARALSLLPLQPS